jgi:hypothetical protein
VSFGAATIAAVDPLTDALALVKAANVALDECAAAIAR